MLLKYKVGCFFFFSLDSTVLISIFAGFNMRFIFFCIFAVVMLRWLLLCNYKILKCSTEFCVHQSFAAF